MAGELRTANQGRFAGGFSRTGTRYLVEFDSADLLRATPTERYATYEKGIKNGIMNPNEAREREGMPPREGGDEFSRAWKQTVEIKGRKDE